MSKTLSQRIWMDRRLVIGSSHVESSNLNKHRTTYLEKRNHCIWGK
jgi:hypothetical protein